MTAQTCFVVQGFGSKTDYTDGRVLNMDASYEVIKQAVAEAGLKCTRADEIIHSGTIDIPMYEQLLRADLVIADLSTYNVNAAFELGVRYGLRPRSTIVIAEEKFKSPFDVNHIVIRRYKHLGEDIGMREARRFKDELVIVIKAILLEMRTDSPVYSMLSSLRPPEWAEAIVEAAEPVPRRGDAAVTEFLKEVEPAVPQPAAADSPAWSSSTASMLAAALASDAAGKAMAAVPEPPSAREWRERAQQALKADDFATAKAAWGEVRKYHPNDGHVIQQLALATYKAKQPTPAESLAQARELLMELSPATTNDPETLGLWGAVHKRMWDLRHDPADLAQAVSGYERGFVLKQDHYNGINLAFLLNLRAVESARQGERDEAIADDVQARRVRRDVMRYAMPLAECADMSDDKRYWVIATLWEAAIGLGDTDAAAQWGVAARCLLVPQWMHDMREEQGARLKALQQELARLRGAH